MISSINSLSPAEKLVTSGSPGLLSSQDTEDLFLMSSAKALLGEFQSDQDQFQDEGSQSLSRKKRYAGYGYGYRAIHPTYGKEVSLLCAAARSLIIKGVLFETDRDDDDDAS